MPEQELSFPGFIGIIEERMSSKTILQIVFAFRVKIAKDSKGGKFVMIKKCILISCLVPALVNKGLM